MQFFEWQHYKILSQMRATSAQSVVGEDRSDINHVNADRDTNQPSTGTDRKKIVFYDATASQCHICNFSVIPSFPE